MYIDVLSAYMSVHLSCTWYLLRPEEGVRSLEPELQVDVGAGN